MRTTSLFSASILLVIAASACSEDPATTGSGGTGGTSASSTASATGTGGDATATSTGTAGGTTGTTGTGGTGGAADPSQLDAPPSGEGVQFETTEIIVPVGTEEQDCYFFKVSELATKGGLDAAKAINLHRVQIAQRDGSHHMNIFRVKTIKGLDPAKGLIQTGTNGMGECFKSPNWSDWPLIANSQVDGQEDWTYPDGVANKLQPDEWIMLQTHWVNANTQVTADEGKVRVNFWAITDDKVTAEMGTLFATKQSIRICETNPTPNFEGTCQIKSANPVNIIGANGHFHSRGTEFDMYAWDGTSITTPAQAARFYQSKSWDEPPMLHSPDLDVKLAANGGVWYSCAFQWTQPDPAVGGCDGLDTYDQGKCDAKCDMVGGDVAACKASCQQSLDCCYTFGGIVEKNEHCNIFVYYYPKQDDINCL